MSEIKNGRLGLYGKVKQFEELGFKGMPARLTHTRRMTFKNKNEHTVLPQTSSFSCCWPPCFNHCTNT